MTLDTSILNLLPSSSIVGLSNTANTTPAYIIPNAVPSSTPSATPKPSSIYATAPSTVVKPAQTSTVSNGQVGYTIKSGDTLSKIAAQYGTSVSALAAANGISNPNLIVAGRSLVIPSAAPAQSPSAAPSVVPAPSGANPTPSQTPAPTDTRPDMSALANAAGQAGLSVADYQTLLGGSVAVSSAEHQQIANELGIPAAEAAAFAKPSQSSQDTYDAAYKNAGLDVLHAKIMTLIESINAKKQQGADAIAKVNENPFLSETSRVGRGKRVLDQVQTDTANDTALLNDLTGMYNQGVTEVNNLVARTSADFKDNATSAQAYLNYLQTKAQQQAEAMKTDRTITASNSITDYLKGRQKATDAKAPDLVGSATTGYYRWDATTRSYVQVIAPKAGTGTGSGTFKPTETQKATVAQFLNTDAGKKLTGGVPVTDADLNGIFSDQTTFYSLLQKANDAGY